MIADDVKEVRKAQKRLISEENVNTCPCKTQHYNVRVLRMVARLLPCNSRGVLSVFSMLLCDCFDVTGHKSLIYFDSDPSLSLRRSKIFPLFYCLIAKVETYVQQVTQ